MFYLDKKHVRSQIPDPANKKRRPGRPRLPDKETYHGVRYNVERFFGWLENYRKIMVRYERMPQEDATDVPGPVSEPAHRALYSLR